MAARRFRIASVALLGFLTLLAFSPGCAAEEPETPKALEGNTLRLTIYDRGSALIEETRLLKLPGSGALVWKGVPKTLNPTSIQLAGPTGLKVLEERFRYDPLTHERLLKEARGKKVVLVETIKETGQERRTDAVLLAAEGPPVFRIGEEVHLGHPGRVVLPSLSQGLVLEPEILWSLEGGTGEAELTARYLAGGLTWSADYVLLVEEASLTGTLSGAFTMKNSSGTDFQDAQVQLVAGQLRRQAEPQAFRMAEAAAVGMAKGMEETPVADLHRYSVEGHVTLEDGRTVRMSFLQAEKLKLARRYEVRGGWIGWNSRRYEEDRLPVAVLWILANTTEAGLGKPLPAGTVRVYVSEGQKPLLLAGEVALSHTPAGTEEVKLETGEAFDFHATRRQTEFRRLSKELYESAWKVEVENKKESNVVVRVIERIPAQAEVVTASHKAERPSADRLEFDVEAPAGGSVEVTYRLRVRQ